MITVYKKIEKKIDNPSGIIEISDPSLLDKPFLLCISAQYNHNKSIYGIIREGAHAARVYTSQENAAMFKIDEMPIDFLGMRFKSDDKYQNNGAELVDRFIYPFLIGDGNKDLEQLIQQANKINIMTYCDGINSYIRIEDSLVERLSQDGFSSQEIDSIISKISLFAVASRDYEVKAQSISFIDGNDRELLNSVEIETFGQLFNKKNSNYLVGSDSNRVLFAYNGTGKHNLKEYFSDQAMVKPVLSGIISLTLQKKINSNFVTANDYLEIIKTFTDSKKDIPELMKTLDDQLHYNGASKYTAQEIEYRKQLDQALKDIGKLDNGNHNNYDCSQDMLGGSNQSSHHH